MKTLKLFPILFLISFCVFAQNTGVWPLATASGTDTYVVTGLLPAFSSYAAGQRFTIKFTNANTGPATLNINSKGALALKKDGSTALSLGDISAGEILFVQHDGTNLQVIGGGGGLFGGSFTDPHISLRNITDSLVFDIDAENFSNTPVFQIKSTDHFDYRNEFNVHPFGVDMASYDIANPGNGGAIIGVGNGGLLMSIDDAGQAIFTDNRTLPKGLQYAADGYVTHARSIPDKGYVDAAIATATPNASESARGLIEIATQSEVNTGTDALRAVTPLTLTTLTTTLFVPRSGSATLTGDLTLGGATRTLKLGDGGGGAIGKLANVSIDTDDLDFVTSKVEAEDMTGGGSSGHVLTSNGAGVAPSWQASSGGGVSGLTVDFVPYATSATAIANSTVKYATSFLYPLQKSLQIQPIHTGGVGSQVFELINTGNPGASSENRMLVPVAAYRHGGNAMLVRNLEWNQALQKWLTPYQMSDAYGSSMFEAGGEAAIIHATPAGVNFHDVPHEILLASANGIDGVAGLTTGYWTQTKAPIFASYSSAAYVPATTANTWNPSTATMPMIYLHSLEAKGAGANVNEYLRLETNSSTAGAYPAFNFARSNGTLASRTAISTNGIMGAMSSVIYDGAADQRTAEIQFVSRGTISSGNAGQSIKFITSPTNTAGQLTRMEIMNEALIKFFNVPLRTDWSATITTIPDYTGNGYSPALSTSTVMQQQPVSTVGGGWMTQGFTVSGTNTAVALMFRGIQGHTSPTGANTVFAAMKHNGTTNFTDIAATEIGFQFRNNATTIIEVNGGGKITNNPTNTAAGTTGAQTINKPSGTVNFAASATTLVVTNSLVTTSSLVFCTVRTNDATAIIKNVVPASGSFTITLNAAATAETSVGFFVIN